MDTPKISIIIPAYKVEKYIRKCLDSVLAQSFRDFEVFLIDDGSPDNSGAICEEYAKKDPRIIFLKKENGGVAAARNLAMDYAKGEWLTFIDPDDWVEVDYLKHFCDFIADDVDMIMCGLDFVDNISSRRIIRTKTEKLDAHTAYAKKNLYRYGYTWGKFYRHSLLKKLNLKFDKKLSFCSDLVLMSEYLLKARNIQFIDFLEYKYYTNPTSITNKYYPFKTAYTDFFPKMKSLVLSYFKERPSDLNIFFLSYIIRSIDSMYRPKLSIDNRATRLENLKILYSQEAEIIDSLPNKSIYKILKNHLSILDIYLKIFFKLRYNFLLSKLWHKLLKSKRNKDIKNRQVRPIYF